MATSASGATPSPDKILATLTAYQQTAALQAAIELNIFTAIGGEKLTAAELAKRCATDERGMRILCDYLTVFGFLTKSENRYGLTGDSAIFLDRNSPACLASAVGFLGLPEMRGAFKDLAAAVKKGGVIEGQGAVEDHNPMWVAFARSMAGMQTLQAEMLAGMLNASADEKWKVLDIAAGHGMYGITLAKHNPNAEIYALDWPSVLEVASENAKAAGISTRHHLIPGSAFEVPFGLGYDIILLTNFLHHFGKAQNEEFLHKVHAALAPNGRTVTVEFVPNEDRVTPPAAATFSLTMLAATPSGDAYTFSDLDGMFRAAGFSSSEQIRFPAGPESVVISKK